MIKSDGDMLMLRNALSLRLGGMKKKNNNKTYHTRIQPFKVLNNFLLLLTTRILMFINSGITQLLHNTLQFPLQLLYSLL